MTLPLIARKNIKDFESTKHDNLMKIKQIFNTEFDFECDMESVYNNVPEERKNSIGRIMYEKYLGSLAVNFALIMADEILMKDFLTAVPAKKILFKVEHFKEYEYTKSVIDDGVYILLINKSENYFFYNVEQAGSDIVVLFGKEKFSSSNPRLNFSKEFNLEIQNNIEKYQPKALEHLNQLNSFLGVLFNFVVDFQLLHKRLPDSVFKKSIGELVLDKYLGALVVNIIDFLKKHPSQRNSFLSNTQCKRITLHILPDYSTEKLGVSFQDGVVNINILSTEFGFLPEKTGNNLNLLFI